MGLPINDGLCGAWLNAEGAPPLSSLHDFSGYGNHGTLVGQTYSVPGEHGSALDFDGSGDRVDLGRVFDEINLTDPHTFIFNATFRAQNDIIIAQTRVSADRYGIWINTSGTPAVNISSYNGVASVAAKHTSSIVLDGTTWNTFACAQYDHDTKLVYFNGVNETIVGGPSFASSSARNLYFGEQLNGKIGYVLLYNRVLSAAEIASLYADPFQGWQRQRIELIVASTSVGGAPPGGDIVVLRRRREAA